MSYKQRSFFTQINRLMVLMLSLTGLLMDGYDGSDLVFASTLVIWLWLPHCTRIEAQILDKIGGCGPVFTLRDSQSVS